MAKISIITLNYNNLEGLIRTHNSVTKQDCSNIEHIVIDGGSSDGSAEYIRKKHSGKFVIENDRGIYDAMQKGLEIASSEYVIYLNSGDVLFSQNLSKIHKRPS